MNNLRYHISTSIAVILMSYVSAITINQVVKFSFSSPDDFLISKKKNVNITSNKNLNLNVEQILESNFFEKADPLSDAGLGSEAGPVPPSAISDLSLIGTVTGPSSIAMAMIKKNGEKEAEIFKMWSDVYGFKLVGINNFKVYLRSKDKQKYTLDMYEKKEAAGNSKVISNHNSSDKVKKTLSRTTIKESLSNLDSALKGLKAGPYRENGKVTGFKLIRIKPSNILFKIGARSGDIIKRINGHPIESTEKLLQMWQNFATESKIVVDIKRGNDVVTYDYTISE